MRLASPHFTATVKPLTLHPRDSVADWFCHRGWNLCRRKGIIENAGYLMNHSRGKFAACDSPPLAVLACLLSLAPYSRLRPLRYFLASTSLQYLLSASQNLSLVFATPLPPPVCHRHHVNFFHTPIAPVSHSRSVQNPLLGIHNKYPTTTHGGPWFELFHGTTKILRPFF